MKHLLRCHEPTLPSIHSTGNVEEPLLAIHLAALETRSALIKKTEEGDGNFDFRQLLDQAREGRASMDEKTLSILSPEPEGQAVEVVRSGARPSRSQSSRGRPGFGSSRGQASVPVQGRAALIYRGSDPGEIQFFDFVNIIPRKSGYKVRLHKDQALNGMTTLNVLYERGDASTINEALAYPIYGEAGNETVGSGFVRVGLNERQNRRLSPLV